jgi:preprotein translocase subunit SecA
VSELLSRILKIRHIKHNVLNAKQHALEAQVVAEAGRAGQVTIATNMAGRGTDIKLTPEVKEAGGLAIIGTERHESRRVDRQLRGRAGRQGDPGTSQFFVSLEDDLMRLFGSDRIATMMDKMGLQEGEVIQAGMMSKAIEKAQKKVEENHFGVRKRLLEYDDVMNSQRTVIYTQRRHALHGERVEIDLNNMMLDFADTFVENTQGADFEDFSIELIRQVAMQPTFDEATYNKASKEELAQLIVEDLRTAYARRAQVVAQTAMPVLKNVIEKQGDQVETLFVPITNGTLVYNVATNLKRAVESDGAEIYKMFTKLAMLTTIDDNWREHLRAMDDLKQSVQNASYEQKDPLLIYKLEAYNLFRAMIDKINREVLSILLKGYIPTRENANDRLRQRQQNQQKVDVNKLQASRMAAAAAAGQGEKSRPMPVHVEKKVRPNDPCPCGSGKKYKHCHGA